MRIICVQSLVLSGEHSQRNIPYRHVLARPSPSAFARDGLASQMDLMHIYIISTCKSLVLMQIKGS